LNAGFRILFCFVCFSSAAYLCVPNSVGVSDSLKTNKLLDETPSPHNFIHKRYVSQNMSCKYVSQQTSILQKVLNPS